MYKKILAILLALAMVFALAACGEKKEPENDDPKEESWWKGPSYEEVLKNLGKADITINEKDGVLASVIEKGTLVIGTSPDYPPAEYVDLVTGEVKGYEIMLAQYIANTLGVELKVESMDFDAVLTSVATGKVDLGISGFGYKADREENYQISIGYEIGSSDAHHTIIVKKDDLGKYNSLSDFDGKVIDAQINSLQEMYVKDQIKDAQLQPITSLDQGILDLLSGKVDAVALDSTTAMNYAAQSDGQIVSVFDEKKIEFDLSLYNDYAGNICVAKKGEVSFMNAINEIIKSAMDGDLFKNMYYSACDDAQVLPDIMPEDLDKQ